MDRTAVLMRLYQMERGTNRAYLHAFADLPVSEMQGTVLMVVWTGACQGRRVCQKDVEEYLSLRSSSVSSLVDGLVVRGLVRRERANDDGRMRHLALTEEGRRVADDVQQRIREFSDHIFSGVTDAALEQMVDTAEAVIENAQRPMRMTHMQESDETCKGFTSSQELLDS